MSPTSHHHRRYAPAARAALRAGFGSAAALVPLAGGLLLSAALAGCGEAGPRESPPRGASSVSVTDDAGRTVSLPRPARRVISLVPSVTDLVVALGGANRLAARTDYDSDPRLATLPSVGGGLDPSLEVIASLGPDLVVAWRERTPKLAPRLEELGVPVLLLNTQDTAGVFANIDRLGTLLDRTEEAGSLATSIRAELDSVRRSVDGRPRRSVLYLVATDPPMTAGAETFPLQLVSVAGGESVFPELRHGWPRVSLEAVVRRDPELILLPLTEGGEGAAAGLRGRAGWREVPAVHAGRIRVLPTEVVNRPGPGLGAAARLIRNAIHPEAGGR
ncbi:MAG: ABC transporter substrate-binding protein [Longimicrobiaceae bacterium]